ncbi:MAG: hypothetical protein IT376_07120 [Polyangiaceae bacterium]|nr:hypothetical protein [Polyangiaceae bacterium]
MMTPLAPAHGSGSQLSVLEARIDGVDRAAQVLVGAHVSEPLKATWETPLETMTMRRGAALP